MGTSHATETGGTAPSVAATTATRPTATRAAAPVRAMACSNCLAAESYLVEPG